MRSLNNYNDNRYFLNALNAPTKVWKIKLVPLALKKDDAYGYAYEEMDEALAINEEFIQSWDISQELCEGNFNFGNFNSSTLKLVLNNKIMTKYSNYENEYKRYFNNTTFVGGCYRIKYSLLCTTDTIDKETGKYITKYIDITMGSYICNKCSKEETKITLEFNDYATRFDNPIDTTQKIAETGDELKIIVQRICLLNNMRYPITFTNNTYRLTKTPNLEGVATYRQLICYIAQLAGCNAIMDHDGYLQFRDFSTEESFLVDKTKYMTNSRADYGFGGFGKIILKYIKTTTTTNEDGETETIEEELATEKGEDVGTVIEFEANPLYDGNQTVIDNIYNKIENISFYPCSFDIDINPLIELGDKFSWENWECDDYYNDKGELVGTKIKRYAYVTNISYSSFKQHIECVDVENGGASRVTSTTSGTTGGGYGGSNGRPGVFNDLVNLNNNIFVDNLEASFAKIDFANITKAVITDAMIKNLSADKITAGTIGADVIHSGKVIAGQIVSTDPDTGLSTYISGDCIKTGSITADKIDSEYVSTIKLDASQIKTGTLGADVIYSGKVKTDQLEAGVVKIGNTLLEPNCITTEQLNTNRLVIPGVCIEQGTITADKMNSDSIFTNKITAGSIVSEDANGNKTFIHGDLIQTGTINGDRINANSMIAGKISADNIVGGHISGDIIEGGSISGDLIQGGEIIGDVTFSGKLGANTIVADNFKLKWGHIIEADIKYADINDATIEQLQAETIAATKITADKITGGTLNLSNGIKIAGGAKFNGENIEQASLVLTSDLLQMRNENSSAGVQLGKGTSGKYGLVIWNEDGTSKLFDSTNGGIQNSGLPSEVVTPDKIDMPKLVADEVFIEALNAIEINAEDIITSSLIVDKIKGMVSFESLDGDLQDNFEHLSNGGTLNKTYINGGNILTGTVTANKLNVNGLMVTKNQRKTLEISDDGDVFIRGNIESFNWDENDINNKGYQITPEGNATFNNATIRGSVMLPYAGITDTNINISDPIRMWAGCSYDSLSENINNANFYVTQSGELFAKKGNFGGTFTGKLKIGNIVIEDTTSTEGQISVSDNSNTEKIKLTADGTSLIRSDININDFVFSGITKDLKGSNTIKLQKDLNSVQFLKGFVTGFVDEFHLINMTGGNAGKHDFYYLNDSPTLNIRGGSINFTTGNKITNGQTQVDADDFEMNINGSFRATKGAMLGGLNIKSHYVTLIKTDENGNVIAEDKNIERIDFLM